MKDIAFIENYESEDYTGPAVKAGAGAQGFELYAAARDFGGTVLGGECQYLLSRYVLGYMLTFLVIQALLLAQWVGGSKVAATHLCPAT